jgi:hypothetical protein
MTVTARRFPLLAFLVVALGCSGTTEPSGAVSARAVPAGIQATNGTTRTIFYTAVEREAAALYDYYPCTDPTACAHISAGATVTVPWSQVVSFDPARHEYLLYWWQAPSASDESVQSGHVLVYRP